MGPKQEQATLGGGCFWCLEAVFEQVQGVAKVVSGYAGGHAPAPTYEAVCDGGTGHAEVVQVTFNPLEISYREILEVFFAIHDPTTPNRQGADVGTQYRSIILTHSPSQEATAKEVLAELAGENPWGRPVVTELEPLRRFHEAESYHQGYFRRNPAQGYCRAVIGPKVQKFQKTFASRLKPAA